MIRTKVYLDEDLDVIIADMLRYQGFEALTVQDANRKGLSDANQLEFATKNEMAILTHNRLDYQRLGVEYFESGLSHAGIILAIQRPPKEISSRTLWILSRYTAKEIRNQIFYI